MLKEKVRGKLKFEFKKEKFEFRKREMDHEF